MVRETREVLVTGVGPVSAIGCGRDAFWNSLKSGRSGIRAITICDVRNSRSKIGAEIDFDATAFADSERRLLTLPRPVQFAIAAVALCLEDAGRGRRRLEASRTGVIVGTSVGNLESIAGSVADWHKHGRLPVPEAPFLGFNHAAACAVASTFDFRGPVLTVSTGCNSGLDALGQARHLIRSGEVDAMLVVGTDSELVTELVLAMDSAGALTRSYNDAPQRASRPFDRGRDGNVIGEGAGALLLESAESTSRRGATPYARVAACRVQAAGNRASITAQEDAPDVAPCVSLLESVVRSAGWGEEAPDAVNANGSSSVIYDRVEGVALREVLGERVASTPVHSIKSMLGQHGAGSSALQTIASCLTVKTGCVPPTINHDDPDPACGGLRLPAEAEHGDFHRILVHSIGLGGLYYSGAALDDAF